MFQDETHMRHTSRRRNDKGLLYRSYQVVSCTGFELTNLAPIFPPFFRTIHHVGRSGSTILAHIKRSHYLSVATCQAPPRSCTSMTVNRRTLLRWVTTVARCLAAIEGRLMNEHIVVNCAPPGLWNLTQIPATTKSKRVFLVMFVRGCPELPGVVDFILHGAGSPGIMYINRAAARRHVRPGFVFPVAGGKLEPKHGRVGRGFFFFRAIKPCAHKNPSWIMPNWVSFRDGICCRREVGRVWFCIIIWGMSCHVATSRIVEASPGQTVTLCVIGTINLQSVLVSKAGG